MSLPAPLILAIDNLKAGPRAEGEDQNPALSPRSIVNGLSLTIRAGETHAIMGPNGTGKSTLSYVLAGHPSYQIHGGSLSFLGQDLAKLSPDERACLGFFLAFQYPVEIPGVVSLQFLKAAANAKRNYAGEAEWDPIGFIQHVRAQAKLLGITEDMLKRAVNSGFSGGEKKRFEALQMAILQPRLAILDETDSGLDIDALKLVAQSINHRRTQPVADQLPSFLIITHYQRLLDYIKPDYVHVMIGGRIVESGGPELALTLEKNGYAGYGGNGAIQEGKAA